MGGASRRDGWRAMRLEGAMASRDAGEAIAGSADAKEHTFAGVQASDASRAGVRLL